MKKIIALLMAMALILGMVACGAKEEAAPEAAPEAEAEAAPEAAPEEEAPAEVIELVYSGGVGNSVIHDVFDEVIVPRLEELSGGTMTIKQFYDGALYATEENAVALMTGDIDICSIDPTWGSEYIPSLSMFGAAYLFEDLEHMDKFLASDKAQGLYDQYVEALGVRPISVFLQGTRNLNTVTDEPILTPTELAESGLIIRVPNSEAWINMGKALGAQIATISFSELYTSLQQGVCDGQDNPFTDTMAGQFQEVAKSFSLTGHFISSYWFCVNEENFSKLTEEQQGWVIQAFAEGKAENDKRIQESEQTLVDELIAQGCTIAEVDKGVWREYANAYYKSATDFTANWDWELYDTIQAMAG